MATAGDTVSSLGQRQWVAGADVNQDLDETAFLKIPAAEALPALPDDAWRRLEERIAAFEAAWADGNPPEIDDFLLADDPTQGQLLIELVHTDLELRIKHGGAADDYLRHFPELTDRPDVIAALRRDEQRLLAETARQFPQTEPSLPARVARGPGEKPVLPGYEIQGEIGRGGMGIVYAATDLSLGRTVAIKTLLPGARDEERRRLQREAEAAAGIQHPHVAQVFQTVKQDDRLYVVSEFLPGGTLEARMAGDPWPIDEAAALMESLARAVAAAHELGIIHRDLKPANILFTADDVPKIADFGLVKRLDDNAEATRTGVIAGSPSYMAPEQAAGDHRIGKSTDVWSLGAILYELLTGRPPFRDASILGTLELIRTAEPVSPRRLVHQPSPDLETICLHCLEKDPAKRYADAGELADDLSRFNRGAPVCARPIGLLERFWRWAKKNRQVAVLATLLAASMLIGSVACLALAISYRTTAKENQRLAVNATEHSRRAARSEQAARRAAHRMERTLLATELGRAYEALASGDPQNAADLIEAQSDLTRPSDRFLLNLLERQIRPPGRSIDHLDDSAYFVTFSPDEELLAACGAAGEIRLYETDTWDSAGIIQANQDELNGIAFSKDGRHIASAGDDGSVVLWDRASGHEVWRTRVFDHYAYELAFVSDGAQLAVCGAGPRVVLLDRTDGKQNAVLEEHTNDVQNLLPSPDGDTFYTTGDDYRTICWDPAEKKAKWIHDTTGTYWGHCGLSLTADGQWLAVGSDNAAVLILEASDGEVIHQGGLPTKHYATALSGGVRAVEFLGRTRDLLIAQNGGTMLETCVIDGRLRLVPRHGRAVWASPRSVIRSTVVSADGQTVVTASDAGWIDVWHRTARPPWRHIATGNEKVRDVAWLPPDHPHGRLLIAGPTGRGFADLESESWRRSDRGDWFSIGSPPSGRTALLSNDRGDIEAVDLTSATPKTIWSRDGLELAGQVFPDSPSDKEIAVTIPPIPAGFERVVAKVYIQYVPPDGRKIRRCGLVSLDKKTGQTLAHLVLEDTTCEPALSPDGERLLVGSSVQGLLFVMDPLTLQTRQTLRGHPRSTSAIAFSSDGTQMATAGNNLRIAHWNGTSRAKSWHSESGQVRSLQFDPTGQALLSTSEDHPPRVWDLETGHLLAEPGRYPTPARPDGTWKHAAWGPKGEFFAVWDRTHPNVTIFDGRPLTTHVQKE